MTLPGLAVVGPTASGKSALAMALAEALERRVRVEIVSVDSAQVYRGMDIGTAKPGRAERARVAHHLVDILDPAERYSAARFVADAHRLAGEIAGRGALPLWVGGTMLYFEALRRGLDAMPEADAAVRADLDARAARDGWPALHAELAAIDPPTAARLDPHDAQRIQRALEVHHVTGRPLSSFHRRAEPAAGSTAAWSRGGVDAATRGTIEADPRPQESPMPMLALEPRDRAWLHARIAQRFAAMLDAGLLDEVRALRARGDLHAGLPSMRAVGYRQAWSALERGDAARLRDEGTAATRQLAKRQLTWLRAMPWRHVVACDDAAAMREAVAAGMRLAGVGS